MIGGILVIVGLAIEKFADWLNERYLGPPPKPHSWVGNIGWLFLMAGIAIEIADADWTTHEISRAKEVAARNDPLNQPAQSAQVLIVLWTEGINDTVSTRDPTALWPTGIKVAFGDPELMKRGAPGLLSPSAWAETILQPGSPNVRWQLKFDRNDFVFSDAGLVTNVLSALSWRKFEIDVPFFRPGAKILHGIIVLTVNNSSIQIPFGSETVQDATSNNFHAFWDSPTNGVAIFNGTNAYSWFRH